MVVSFNVALDTHSSVNTTVDLSHPKIRLAPVELLSKHERMSSKTAICLKQPDQHSITLTHRFPCPRFWEPPKVSTPSCSLFDDQVHSKSANITLFYIAFFPFFFLFFLCTHNTFHTISIQSTLSLCNSCLDTSHRHPHRTMS